MSVLSTTSASNQITVNINSHGALDGDYVQIQNVSSAVGGIPAAEINATHLISNVALNSFTITVATPASSSATYTAPITFTFDIHAGQQTAIIGYGWGSGGWGENDWGATINNPFIIPPRLYTQDRFGNNLIFCIRNADIYYWPYTVGLTGRAKLLSSAPGAASVPQIVGSILFSQQDGHLLAFGGTEEYPPYNYDPMLIRWSSQNAPEFWTSGNVTVPSTGFLSTAGFKRVTNGSQIVRALRTKEEILVFTDSTLYSLRYTGTVDVFLLDQISDNISIASQSAATTVNSITYWMGIDKFYVYTGRVDTLPCSLRQYIFQDINIAAMSQVVSGTNEQFNEIIWFYASAGSSENNRYVIFNYLEQIWYYGQLDRTAWLDSPLRPVPQGAGADRFMYNHEEGVDAAGAPMESYIASGDIDIEDGDKFMLLRRVIPDVNFVGSTATNPQVKMTVSPRNFPGQEYQTNNAESTGLTKTVIASRDETTAIIDQYTNQVFLRARGRQMRYKISSDSLGVQWQLGMPRIDARPDGQRG